MTGLLLSYYANLPTGPGDHPHLRRVLSSFDAARRPRRTHLPPRPAQASGSLIPQLKECRVMKTRFCDADRPRAARPARSFRRADAADKVKAVASFSILGDMVQASRRRPRRCRHAGRAGWRRACVQPDAGRRQGARVRADLLRQRPRLRGLDGAAGEILWLQGRGGGREHGREAAHHDRGGGRHARDASPIPMPGRTSPTASSMSPISATG